MDEMQRHIDSLAGIYEKLDMKVKQADRDGYYRVLFTIEELDSARSELAQLLTYMRKLQTRM